MKAVILAAGKGTRLKQITQKIPKPLLQVHGEPILAHQLNLCAGAKIKDVFINTHYLPDQIRNFAGDGSKFGVHISYSYEPELLGTAGALNNFRSYLTDEEVLVVYGDNYFDVDLRELQRFHAEKHAFVTVAVHRRDDVSQSGMIELDSNARVKRFVEKPALPDQTSNLVSAGIYLLDPRVLSFIPSGYSDFGYDIIPKLIAENKLVFGFELKAALIAVDTPELYQAAIQNLPPDRHKMC